MDSEYIIQTFFTLSGLCNSKCVNHTVESPQMGWKMLFPDYIICKVQKQYGLFNPNYISIEVEAIYFGWASVLEYGVQHFGL